MNNRNSAYSIQNSLKLPHPIETPGHEIVLGIMGAARLLTSKARKLLNDTAELTPAQFNILMILKHQFPEGASQVDLSRRILVNRANVTGLIDRLERDGMVVRTASPSDRRQNIVRLTEKGTNKLIESEPAYHETIAEITKHIPDEEKTQIAGTIASICDILEDSMNS